MADEDALQRLLRLAAVLPAYRPDFYRTLLDGTVYVLGHSDRPAAEGARTVEANELTLQTWAKEDGTAVIAFFSSLEELKRAIEQDSRYLALTGRALFDMTRGATLVLNPRSDYSKEFAPEEIDALLAGGVNRMPDKRVTDQARQVSLKAPENYPAEMVAALITFLARREHARAAYLAQMHDPDDGEQPHLVIGVEAEGEAEQLIRELCTVAADSAPPEQPVDLVHVVRGREGLSEYFINEVEPFYKRA